MNWSVCAQQFRFPRPVLIMGVVNVTPDSFSDGGRFAEPAAAVAHGVALATEGADLIDLGGESTRPGAGEVSETEEARRVLPVIAGLRERVAVPISVDTQKPGIARAAVDAGASIINDVAANRSDPEMWKVVAETGAGYVAMHMQGRPLTMQQAPDYKSVVQDVEAFFTDRLEQFVRAGIQLEQVVLDVGIGFGKSVIHNLELLRNLHRFTRFGRPLLLGVSRKSFLGRVIGAETHERLPAALACSSWAVGQGVAILRTHDVKETRMAVRMVEAIQSVEA